MKDFHNFQSSNIEGKTGTAPDNLVALGMGAICLTGDTVTFTVTERFPETLTGMGEAATAGTVPETIKQLVERHLGPQPEEE